MSPVMRPLIIALGRPKQKHPGLFRLLLFDIPQCLYNFWDAGLDMGKNKAFTFTDLSAHFVFLVNYGHLVWLWLLFFNRLALGRSHGPGQPAKFEFLYTFSNQGNHRD